MRLFIGISIALHSVALISGGGQLLGTPFTGTPVSVTLQSVTGVSPLPDTTGHNNAASTHARRQPLPTGKTSSPVKSDSVVAMKPAKDAISHSTETANMSGSSLHNPQRYAEKPDATPASNVGDLLTSELHTMFTANFRYPSIARRNNWEGNLLAGVRIEEDGRLSNISLIKTSGYNVLDNAALQGIQDIRVLTAARDWLKGQHFDIVLPVKYRLVNK